MAVPAAPQPIGGSPRGAPLHPWSIPAATVFPDDLLGSLRTLRHQATDAASQVRPKRRAPKHRKQHVPPPHESTMRCRFETTLAQRCAVGKRINDALSYRTSRCEAFLRSSWHSASDTGSDSGYTCRMDQVSTFVQLLAVSTKTRKACYTSRILAVATGS